MSPDLNMLAAMERQTHATSQMAEGIDRQAAALERIAAALEMLAGVRRPPTRPVTTWGGPVTGLPEHGNGV